MTKFESSLGSKTYNTGAMREFDIPDGEEEVVVKKVPDRALLEKEFQTARQMKATNKVKISDGAKRRIEMLMGMTYETRVSNINGQTYTFRILSANETREAIKAVMPYDGTVEAPFEARRQFLARSLTHIDGVELGQFLGDSSLEIALEFIDALGNKLVDRLYTEYTLLCNESKNKYSIKSEEDLKEVVEDIKK